jgi:hypothetical protein
MKHSILQYGSEHLLTSHDQTTEDRLSAIAQTGRWACVALGEQSHLFSETLCLMVRVDAGKEHITVSANTAAKFGFYPGVNTNKPKQVNGCPFTFEETEEW